MVPSDLEKAMEKLGLTVVKVDDEEVTAKCPGHPKILGREDRNPSWSVNRRNGVHHCFSCGYGGTFEDLVIEQLDLTAQDIWKATRWIISQGVDIDPENELQPYNPVKVLQNVIVNTPMDEKRLLKFGDVPDAELKKRRIDRDAVDALSIRWSLADSAWILPIRLPSGALIGWQTKKGRFVRNVPDEVKKSQTLFGIELFQDGMIPVIVESQLDVARFRSVKDMDPKYCALAMMGSKLSKDQQRLLVHLADEAIFAGDNPRQDPAGAAAIDRVINGKFDKWGNKIEEPLIMRLPLTFMNYSESDAKDLGEMTDDEIHWSLDNALGALEALEG